MNPLWLLLLACATTPGTPGATGIASAATRRSVIREPAVPRDARAWFLTAQVAEDRGDLEDAEEGLRWVTLLDGQRAWAWLEWGDFLWRRGRWEEAIEAYRTAVAREPGLAEAQAALGRGLLERGDAEEGVAALRGAVRAGDLPAWQRLAAWVAREQPAELAELLDAPPAPLTSGARLDRARLWLEADAPERALPDLEVLLDDRPHDGAVAELFVEAGRRACRVHTLERRAVEDGWLRRDRRFAALALRVAEAVGDPLAEATARTALLDERETAEQARLRILALHRSGGEVGGALEAALLDHPEDGGLRHLQAELAWQGGDIDRAERLFMAIEGRWRGPALRSLAAAWTEAGAPDRARTVLAGDADVSLSWPLARLEASNGQLEAALARLGAYDGAELLRRQGLLYGLAGDLERSEALLAQAAAGGVARAWAELAAVEARRGDSTAAAAAWRQLVEADPTEWRGWLGLAELTEDPRPLLERAREEAPCSHQVLLAAAAADPPRAVELLEAAREVAPHSVVVLDELGQAYYRSQMFEAAAETWSHAQALEPDPVRVERLDTVLRAVSP